LNCCEHLVYTLHGDGDLQVGQIWEAAMYAAGNKVDNLISIIDFNNAQIDGKVENVLPNGSLKDKFLAFGWEVVEMQGNDMKDCVRGLSEAKKLTKKGKPVVILMHTLMGYGVDFMQGSYKWHGVAPSNEQLASALSQLKETLGDY
ncbi:MAG: transketolase, partial [Bacteroidaceae bacterium]|nr:transketolase [Bacteroidaceae bacterium]